MTVSGYVVLGLLLLGAIWLITYLSGNPGFWHVAAKYPDEAYEWFSQDPGWIVVHAGDPTPRFPGGGSEYVGPFTLYIPQLGNERVKVYALADRLEDSQTAFLASLGSRGISPKQ